jgi:Fe-S-cluster containining protein
VASDELRPEDLFRCTCCGDCCRGYGGTYVGQEDLAAIAAFLHTVPGEVVRRYCRASGGRYVLGQGSGGYCVFWDGLCRIHPVKPRMCRRWPFIPSVVGEPRNWLIMAGACPGMRTDIPLSLVRSCVEKALAAEGSRVDP